MPKNDWKNVHVGSLIAVHFRKEKCYYACKVVKKKGMSFKVEYEDNTFEWKNLAKVPFRWQELPNIDDEEKERSSEEEKDSSGGEDEESSSEEDENSSYGEDVETREDEK
eukprot:CAMPEP_0197283114 /NCGR_PEP_ID=MMETSP1432-20130617/24769_1 /TAXON_ID=44447 /ORGANISM="Pseudo-nitzschia delicatissima, Strain UNC1205" /LENGTH=109 /DNA_ID=CAMNT_0042750099 /DNA_START=1270 /DNA_END=1599 /DNA_ORIENTATION=+